MKHSTTIASLLVVFFLPPDDGRKTSEKLRKKRHMKKEKNVSEKQKNNEIESFFRCRFFSNLQEFQFRENDELERSICGIVRENE